MYYDVYEDIVLLRERKLQKKEHGTLNLKNSELLVDDLSISETENMDLIHLLSLGYRKIYRCSKCTGEYRKMDLKWVSPYKEGPLDSYYICKEDGKRFYGCIKSTFYNPRYASDRIDLRKYLKNHLINKKFFCEKESLESLVVKPKLTVVGSGISPYTVYLGDLFLITEYECNPEAYRLGMINKILNNISDVTSFCEKYKAKLHAPDIPDILLSIMPAKDINYHKNYVFKKDLIVYYTSLDKDIENQIESLNAIYKTRLSSLKIARPYSKNINTYRIHLQKI